MRWRRPEGAGSGDGGGEGHGKNWAPSSPDLMLGRRQRVGGAVTRKVCEGLGRWGRGGAAELARVCGGGGHSFPEPEESGERRGWGGAGGGPSGSRDLPPLLLPLPSLVPFPGSHGTPPATPSNPHGPRRQSSVCSFVGCLASRAVLGCCRPLLSALACSSSSAGRSLSVSSPRRPSKQPLALSCSVFLLALPLPTLDPLGRTSRTSSGRLLGTTLTALRVLAQG